MALNLKVLDRLLPRRRSVWSGRCYQHIVKGQRHTHLLWRVDAKYCGMLFAYKHIILHHVTSVCVRRLAAKTDLDSNTHVVEVARKIRRWRDINPWFNGDDHALLEPIICGIVGRIAMNMIICDLLSTAIEMAGFVQIDTNWMTQEVGIKHSFQITCLQAEADLVQFHLQELTTLAVKFVHG